MKSIRWRIGSSVFWMVAALHVALSLYVLGRVWNADLDEVDDDLIEELVELSALDDPDELGAYIRSEASQNTKWDEDFFEVRDAGGRRILASPNVPDVGLGPPLAAEPLRARRRGTPELGAIVWNRHHPHSRKGHVKIRVAEVVRADGARVTTAESLKARQKSYWRLREQLAWSLLGVALIAAGGAWWVARRSLAPIGALTERARELGASRSGSLPRSGRGDELDRLAEVLNQMLERIRAEVQRVRRLSADAAHALRTPLAAIRGTLEVHMSSRARADVADLAPALEVLDETSALVSRLLLLERLESMALEPARMHDVRLDALASEVVDALSVVADERKIALECSAEPVRVRADADQLRNALLNLVDNALRHTPPGGRIDVSVRAAGGRAQLVVHDTGPGLRPDQLARLFERFYSEHEDGRGTGLGLPIARAIAEAHGGTLVASSPNGARFELSLPLA